MADGDLLAHADIATPKDNAWQSLRIQLGTSAMPKVVWRGQTLEQSRWTYTSLGHQQASRPKDTWSEEFLGYLGLLFRKTLHRRSAKCDWRILDRTQKH